MSKKSLVRSSLLSVLLLGTLAASAQAYTAPLSSWYTCFYYNYNGPAMSPGRLAFTLTGTTYLSGIEVFQTAPQTNDNRRVVFAKPVDHGWYTTWEFTEPVDGVQCKDTEISNGGRSISFENCTDGESRYCQCS